MLLQLYVLYYGLAPVLTLDAFTAAVVGLGLNYAAYESELYRAGLDAVPVGQTEAMGSNPQPIKYFPEKTGRKSVRREAQAS